VHSHVSVTLLCNSKILILSSYLDRPRRHVESLLARMAS
jgi:hypothetical protein